jgi:hypothetical protein
LKYKLRLLLMPALARAGRMFGIPWPTLGTKLGREAMIAQAAEIRARSAETTDQSPQPLDILFLTMIGGHTYNSSVDIVLGLALQARGHRVRFVICDQQLPACEVKKATNRDHWDKACQKCWSYGKSIYSRFGFEILPVSELIKNRTPVEDPDRWTEIIDASLLKHFGVGVLDKTPAHSDRRHAYQKSVEISQMVGEALVEMAPDRVLMSHGIYSTWGPQLQLLNEAKIPVVTFSKCKKRHTEKFNWTTSADWWDVSNEWEQVRDRPLTQEQHALVDNYLESRRDHSADTLKYNFGDEESKSETYERLQLDPEKPTFVAFTNVLWDAASAQREIVFSDPITWIIDTIRWFASHPDRQLVVKIHPAEIVIGTNQPFAQIIRERVPELPANVRVIEPHEKVNSWSIMQIADLGLVHTSTIGMEMPLEGIPCAVVSRTHFRERGFTIDVNDRDEYFRMIENWNIDNVDIESMRTLAKRYAFLLFERYQLPFQFFYEPKHTDVRAMNFESVSELADNPVMKLIVTSLEQKRDFLLPAEPAKIQGFWR